MKHKYSNCFNYKDTLCWHCANAVPNKAGTRGCSWSRKLIPVEGWEAIERAVYAQRYVKGERKTIYSTFPSYIVRKCPEFVPDGREDEE